MIYLDELLRTLRDEQDRARRELDRLNSAVTAIEKLIGEKGVPEHTVKAKRRRKMSAAARRKIAAGQRARWAKVRKQKPAP